MLQNNPIKMASPRDGYESMINKNLQLAQKQTNAILNGITQMNKKIPMQGNAQKLDIIA